MGGIWTASSNFTKGQLDPLLFGRTDLAVYYQGVQEATNVLAIPQGGLKKRPGTEFIGIALDDGRLENFSFNVEQNYLLVFTDLRMQIFKDGILQVNINGSGNDFLVTPYTLAQIRLFDYIQSADTIIITHEDVAPQIIQRTSDTDWTIGDVPLTNIPQFDFNDVLSPTPIDEIQTMAFVSVTNGDTFKLSLDGILTDDIAYSTSGQATTASNMQVALQDLPNTGSSGVAVVSNGANAYTVTFSGDSADDYGLLIALPVITVDVNFAMNAATTQNGTSRAEDVWSVTRGYPRTCTFHEARLWFGGSKSRPSTIWGSKVNDVFNFDAGRGRDDEGIDVTLATDQVNAVTGIISNRALQVFTTGAEFFVPTSPITPENVAVQPQTNLGSKRVRPITIEGVTLYIQRTGKAIYQFQFIDSFQSNESKSVSILTPGLIKDPVQMSATRGTNESDANYVYIVSNDGQLTVFNTLILEGVQAFTNWVTSGLIKSVAVVSDELYTLVQREIDSSTVFYIERAQTVLNTDSAVRETVNSDTLTGLDHLEGETVKVKADGAVQTDEVVVGGQITIDRVATIIEAGLEYQPRIQTMPFSIQLNNGPNIAQKKRITRVAVQLFESNGVLVNDQFLADRTIGQDQFDAPIPQTGIKRIYLHGWSLEASVVISQETPMPMTILGLDLEVKV